MSNQDRTAKQRAGMLQQYVSDMIAVENQIAEAVKRQAGDEHVATHTPAAGRIIQNISQLAQQHEQHLQDHLKSLGGDPAKGIKEAATQIMGALAGIYDKLRTESVSKMLRDDYTALNLAAVSYTMLHTTGLALQDQATADLALRHLRAYAEIIIEINRIIPRVVVEDLRDDLESVEAASAQRAIENTQQAWQPSTPRHSTFGTS